MKKAGMGASGVKKPFKHMPGKLSLSTLEADVGPTRTQHPRAVLLDEEWNAWLDLSAKVAKWKKGVRVRKI